MQSEKKYTTNGRSPNPYRALAAPLVQTATYTFDDTADLRAFQEAKPHGGLPGRRQYGRYGNPTVRVVEDRLAALEEGDDALLYPSGMAAISNVLLTLLSAGDHLILTDDCYSKTREFCHDFLTRLGIEVTQIPMGDYGAMATAVQPNTHVIFSESPTNPYLRVVDLERLAAIAKQHEKITTVIDATFATPINQRPLTFGIDLVIHSATKYLSGQNDIMGGVVVGGADQIAVLRQSQGTLGNIIDPHAAFLLERSLKTLGLRVRQQNQSAQAIAEFLESHPRIERAWYPALPSHPDYAVARAQMDGFGGVVSFEVAPRDGETAETAAAAVIDKLQIPLIAPSLGGVESLVGQIALVSYYDKTTAERLELGIKDNLIRYAAGVENTNDILADLEQALR